MHTTDDDLLSVVFGVFLTQGSGIISLNIAGFFFCFFVLISNPRRLMIHLFVHGESLQLGTSSGIWPYPAEPQNCRTVVSTAILLGSSLTCLMREVVRLCFE